MIRNITVTCDYCGRSHPQDYDAEDYCPYCDNGEVDADESECIGCDRFRTIRCMGADCPI